MSVTYVGQYLSTSDDLWLPAHQPIVSSSRTPEGGFSNFTTYMLDNEVNVLACTEQLQMCNPNRGPNDVRCTPMIPLSAIEDAYTNSSSSGYLEIVLDNEIQTTTASALFNALDFAHLRTLLSSFSNLPLLVNDLQEQTASLGLPDNQWLLESDHLFALTLNTIQRYVTEFATGPPNPYSQYTAGWLADNPSYEFLCSSQIIRSPNFTSFSILGISLIFGLGGLTICISLCLERIVAYLQQKYRRGLLQQVRWRLDSKLQLQRLAFEEAGLGQWEGGGEGVPKTMVKGQMIELPTDWTRGIQVSVQIWGN